MAAAGYRIALLIRSLNYGGTEVQVVELANGLARAGHTVSVLLFYPEGLLRRRLSPDITVRSLEKRGRWDLIAFLCSLFRVLEEERPQVLYTFLPVGNLVGCLAGLRRRHLKITWGVRASNMDLARYDWLARFTYWLEARFSRCPDLIISNSAAGRLHALSRGFPGSDHFVVIPNGIDVERFRPDPTLRDAVRAEWGILSEETLVGIVARLDPMKDHPGFLDAAAKVARSEGRVRFVSVGAGSGTYAALLRDRVRALALEERLIWAGPRDDLPAVYNALDLLVSSSAFGEGFSNVLGEAMACGVPCVATDVGDAREILGEGGTVVPPSDPDALAASIVASLKRLRSERASLRAKVRERVVENFSVETLVQRTRTALERIA